jgi:hypothetical protein
MKLLSLFAMLAIGTSLTVVPALACGDDSDCDGSKCPAKASKKHSHHGHHSKAEKAAAPAGAGTADDGAAKTAPSGTDGASTKESK